MQTKQPREYLKSSSTSVFSSTLMWEILFMTFTIQIFLFRTTQSDSTPKNKKSVFIYSPSYPCKPAWFFFAYMENYKCKSFTENFPPPQFSNMVCKDVRSQDMYMYICVHVCVSACVYIHKFCVRKCVWKYQYSVFFLMCSNTEAAAIIMSTYTIDKIGLKENNLVPQ